jgi:ribosome-binding ATPase YchF (GTP1/OBG family)
VPLEVGIVGLRGAGKTTLFNALTHAHARTTEFGKPHVGMASVAEGRLEEVARVIGSHKVVHAAMRILDAPGTGAALLGNLRETEALLAVVDGYSADADPAHDLETLRLELLVADRDHVEKRLDRVRTQAKSGEPKLRAEVAELERALAHLESEQPLSAYPGELSSGLEPLTTKPLIPIQNGGPGGIDLKLEAELAELDDEEAAEFREGKPVLDEVTRSVFNALDLISFFTANENEAHAWTLRRGQTALQAAGKVHSDMARGFIRCEVIRWDELVDCGSRAEAARRGLQRLEGKTYAVADGDVLNIRFNV